MSDPTQKTVLIVGDTDRWISQAISALPEGCRCYIRKEYITAIEALCTSQHFDLCILANRLDEANAGIRILAELQEEDDPHVIIYSREITFANKQRAEELGAVVIDMNLEDSSALKHAVRTFMPA